MSKKLIGVSPNICKIRELIDLISDKDINVVVQGETGVGKEVIVNQLYRKSNRYRRPFLKINCAALPDTLLESEMFGYEKGAFTGAYKRMRGKFEQANGGVLFLDEIGDMSLGLQSKLLRSLQDGEYSRLGSEQTQKSDVWVIAATNHNLENNMKKGKFRKDLYYRLCTIKIGIDPLRQRPEDIPPLIEYYNQIYGIQLNRKPVRLTDNNTMEKLLNYHWPGNVRQLQNVLRRMIVLGEVYTEIDDMMPLNHKKLDADNKQAFDIKPKRWIELLELNKVETGNLSDFSLKHIQKETEEMIDKKVISYVLQKTGWNRSKAQRILNISYHTLLKKITQLDLQPPPELQ